MHAQGKESGKTKKQVRRSLIIWLGYSDEQRNWELEYSLLTGLLGLTKQPSDPVSLGQVWSHPSTEVQTGLGGGGGWGEGGGGRVQQESLLRQCSQY